MDRFLFTLGGSVYFQARVRASQVAPGRSAHTSRTCRDVWLATWTCRRVEGSLPLATCTRRKRASKLVRSSDLAAPTSHDRFSSWAVYSWTALRFAACTEVLREVLAYGHSIASMRMVGRKTNP